MGLLIHRRFRAVSALVTILPWLAIAEPVERVERAESLTVPTVESQSLRPRKSRRVNWADRRAGETLRYLDAVSAVHLDWTAGTSEADGEWLGAWAELATRTLGQIDCADLATIRAIGEVRTPRTTAEAENQAAELAHFRATGYNAVLAVWHGEDARVLSGILYRLHRDGWRIVLAYGQPEGRDKTRPYRRLDTFRARLGLLLEYAEAFAPAWRGTSIPHTRQPAKLAEYHRQVSAVARELRGDIPILGEAFLRGQALEMAVPDYAGGAVLFNAGYSRIRAERVLDMLADSAPGLPVLTLVIGPRPYYASWHAGTETRADLATLRESIATRYRAGRSGTITLAGDGADNRAPTGKHNWSHDTLTRSQWRPDQ
jgi:hypothetical protein